LIRFIIFPILWLGRFLGLKKTVLENYRTYRQAWRLIKNFK
jgi:hypothetical protein